MLQVRKSRSYGISAIFFHCCFMIEAQILMTISNFLRFFSRNYFLEGGFTFQCRGEGEGVCVGVVCFSDGGFIFKCVCVCVCVCMWRCPLEASILIGGFQRFNLKLAGLHDDPQKIVPTQLFA